MSESAPNPIPTQYKPVRFGIIEDYEYSATHVRDRMVIWSGPFASVWEADAYSLPKRDGYMLTTYNGDRVRVECEMRSEENYQEVDAAINSALNTHYEAIGARSMA